MANDILKSLDNALANVQQDRRGFLRTMLVGSAVAAIPAMTTQAVAEDAPPEEGKKKKKKKNAD